MLLTETRLREGRLGDAQEVFARLTDDERKARKLSSRFLMEIVEGRLAAASGDKKATALFRATRKRAMSAGIKLYDLYAELAARYPFTLPAEMLRVAVNAEFGDWSQPLAAGDAVVFIPPVAGG